MAQLLFRTILVVVASSTFLEIHAKGELLSGGSFDDDRFSLVYHAETGELRLDYVTPVLSPGFGVINITSAAGIFAGTVDTGFPLGLGAFGDHTDHQIFFFRDGSGKDKPFSFGNVAVPGLDEEFLLRDLKAVGVFQSATDIGPVDLIYIPVPEPGSITLLLLGSLPFSFHGQFRALRISSR